MDNEEPLTQVSDEEPQEIVCTGGMNIRLPDVVL